MILFLLLLIVAFAIVAVYATGNTGTHDLTLWQWHWAAVPDWVPVVLAAAVIGGTLLAALYQAGFNSVAHGPVVQDIVRAGGDAAIARALAWIIDRAPEALEPAVRRSDKTAAFNMTILSHLLGTPHQPDFDGHVLMLEEVSEAMYRIDRSLFHITSDAHIRRVAGIMLGRCNKIPPNEPDFGMTEEEVARYWCRRSGIPWLGRADIGHDIDNKIVPFGGRVRPGALGGVAEGATRTQVG